MRLTARKDGQQIQPHDGRRFGAAEMAQNAYPSPRGDKKRHARALLRVREEGRQLVAANRLIAYGYSRDHAYRMFGCRDAQNIARLRLFSAVGEGAAIFGAADAIGRRLG